MIHIHGNPLTFHLTNASVSYIIEVMANGQLELLYYGKRLHDRDSFHHLHDAQTRAFSVVSEQTPDLNLNAARQEYPCFGTGDFRMPAVTVQQRNGSRLSAFVYQSHAVLPGKPAIAPLPATYTESDDEAETLELTLLDAVTGVELVLSYTIFRDLPAIARHARLIHRGQEPVVLDRALSACVDLPDMDYEMVHFAGAWARERQRTQHRLDMGIQAIQSLRGASSSEHNPFLILKRPHTTEHSGEAYGFSLVYSGNFLAQVECTTFGQTRVTMGIHPETFAWPLAPGESFTTPELVLIYTDAGLNALSQTYHRLYRTRLARGVWRDRPRPILLNNWEATYFDFDEERILSIAEKAKDMGVELFVLDDGWFGKRCDDHRGLGDWVCNPEKLPHGISGLSERIEALGLKFGLWFEMEMVNKDSDLYRAHPDWIIAAPDRPESVSRNQNVLDFSRPEVVEAIYTMVAEILRSSKVSYIKWDMNRYISEPYSRALPAEQQGTLYHRQLLGVYALYTRLTTEFPDILFESCAGGGARFDPGMLAFAPQGWCSDNTDAAERLRIQYGTSYCYPTVSVGSHVSAVPNHQAHRVTPLSTRANVAYFGTFGYEMDLNLLSESELKQVRAQIDFMKAFRRLIQIDGDFYRLVDPFTEGDAAWITVAQDKSRAVAGYYQLLTRVNSPRLHLKLAGLDPNERYAVSLHTDAPDAVPVLEAWGDELMQAGLQIERERLLHGDFSSLLWTLERI